MVLYRPMEPEKNAKVEDGANNTSEYLRMLRNASADDPQRSPTWFDVQCKSQRTLRRATFLEEQQGT